MYESRPHTVIISLDNSLYKIPEVTTPTATSLISTKKGRNLISQTRKFIFCLIHSQSKGKIITTSMTLMKGSSIQQQQQRNMVMTEHRRNFSSPTWVPHKFQLGKKVWLHLQKEHLTRAHQKLRPRQHGPYTITKVVEIMLQSIAFLHSFTYTKCSMCTSLDHASHHYSTHPRL